MLAAIAAAALPKAGKALLGLPAMGSALRQMSSSSSTDLKEVLAEAIPEQQVRGLDARGERERGKGFRFFGGGAICCKTRIKTPLLLGTAGHDRRPKTALWIRIDAASLDYAKGSRDSARRRRGTTASVAGVATDARASTAAQRSER